MKDFRSIIIKIFGFPKGESWLRRTCRAFWWILGIGILAILSITLAIIFNWYDLSGDIPSIKKAENPRQPEPSVVYTSDSVEVMRFYSQNRTPVRIADLDSSTVRALLATEDIRFYDHCGVDAKSTLSIFWYLLKGDNRGGSTLSQQLAKNLFNMRKEHKGKIDRGVLSTVIAKAKEWVLAVRLERDYTKDEIMEMYLNEVSFGRNTLGLHAASKKYFSVSPDSLDVHQSALLVGLLKAPSNYDPITHPKKAKARRNTVLSQMQKYEYLDAKTAQNYKEKPLDLDIYYQTLHSQESTYYAEYAARKLKEWAAKHKRDLYADGLTIYLTIDSKLQKYAEKAVFQQLPTYQERLKSDWGGKAPWEKDAKTDSAYVNGLLRKNEYYKHLIEQYDKDSADILVRKPKQMEVFSWKNKSRRDTLEMSTLDSLKYYRQLLRSGLLSLDPYTGNVKAWVGGLDFNYFKYDQVYQARRQPGSTFKLFVYTAAIDSLDMSPCDTIQDANPVITYEENGEQKTWTPHNADWVESFRYMTLRHAIGRSMNTIAAKLTQQVSPEVVANYAKKMGIRTPLKEVPSIGLGASEVTLFDLVSAYATIPNQGVWQEPQILWHVKDRHGNTINYFYNESKRVISKESAWLMSYMLRGGTEEPHGTSLGLWRYKILGGINQIGGKTGTTSDFADGWYVGISRDLVTGVWVGGEDRTIRFRNSRSGQGSKTAMPIFGEYMKALYEDPKSGIHKAPLLPATVQVSKSYYCPTADYDSEIELDTTTAEKAKKPFFKIIERVKDLF